MTFPNSHLKKTILEKVWHVDHGQDLWEGDQLVQVREAKPLVGVKRR